MGGFNTAQQGHFRTVPGWTHYELKPVRRCPVTRKCSILAASLLASALGVTLSSAQTQYVRYSVDGGDIAWGVLEDAFINRLSDAPYWGGKTDWSLDPTLSG